MFSFSSSENPINISEKTTATIHNPGGKYHHHISLIRPPFINAKLSIMPQLFIVGSPSPKKDIDASENIADAIVNINFGIIT
jgi:hypothetical protein